MDSKNNTTTQELRDYIFFIKDEIRIMQKFADMIMNKLLEMDAKLLDQQEIELMERLYERKVK